MIFYNELLVQLREMLQLFREPLIWRFNENVEKGLFKNNNYRNMMLRVRFSALAFCFAVIILIKTGPPHLVEVFVFIFTCFALLKAQKDFLFKKIEGGYPSARHFVLYVYKQSLFVGVMVLAPYFLLVGEYPYADTIHSTLGLTKIFNQKEYSLKEMDVYSLAIPIQCVMGLIGARLLLIVPAAAMNINMTFSESWVRSRPFHAAIWVVLLVLCLVTWAFKSLLLLPYGGHLQPTEHVYGAKMFLTYLMEAALLASFQSGLFKKLCPELVEQAAAQAQAEAAHPPAA
ncbi:hypothetical protein GC177_04965 [bacterium]|nr:hypothetical protein [bacterium]